MNKHKYTKSRMHEKLNGVKKMSCVITGLFLVSTVVLNVFAKGNTSIPESKVCKVETFEAHTEAVIGTQRIIEVQTITNEAKSEYIYIRCTAYCDTGYTASGAWTTEGCLAGKREWLGKTCRLYKVNKDNTMGECIGTFTFKDTGFGLSELNGVEYTDGTIMNGASIDMWHPTEDDCWSWIGKYGDYVYMEFVQ